MKSLWLRAVVCAVASIPAPLGLAQKPQPHQLQTLRKFDPPYRLPEGVKVEADLVFATTAGRELHLDLFAPDRGSAPLPGVLFIQGSGHNGNNKVHFWREAAHLAQREFVTVTVEHRGLGPDRARWPAQLEDCEAALQWMIANASRYRVDPARVAVVGASSGAHIAALLASTHRAAGGAAPTIRAVVAVSGLLDLVYFAEHRVWSEEYRMWLDFVPLLGVSYEVDPDRWRQASPLTHLTRAHPPILVIHGTSDGTLPFSQAERYYQAARSAGVAAQLMPVDGGGHEMTNAFAYSATLSRIETFLVAMLK